jgi:hypothetical protein
LAVASWQTAQPSFLARSALARAAPENRTAAARATADNAFIGFPLEVNKKGLEGLETEYMRNV